MDFHSLCKQNDDFSRVHVALSYGCSSYLQIKLEITMIYLSDSVGCLESLLVALAC